MRVARALENLPLLSEAMRRGELSYAKVRALTRVATVENEERLLELAHHGTAAHVETVVRAWRRVDRLEERAAEDRRHDARYFRLYVDQDGSFADRIQVVVHVDAVALQANSKTGQSVLDGGARVSAETSRRIACDASRVTMVSDLDGNVLDVGRRSRAVPSAIRRALESRDRGCRFPACGLRFCDAHHIVHWADGGETKLENLVLLCRRHHRAVHERGFRIVHSGRVIGFQRPDGRSFPDSAPLSPLPEHATARLMQRHQAGLEIDPWTPTPDRHGERLDLRYAITSLRRGA